MSEHESTEDGGTPEPGPDPHGGGAASVDANLSDLRARLDELQQSVEMLGAQGAWTPDPFGSTDPYAPPPYESPVPYEPAAPYQPPPQPPAYPGPPAYAEPSAYAHPERPIPTPYEPSPFEPPSYEPPVPEPYRPPPARGPHPGYAAPPPPPPVEPPLTYPAPPAATNGHGTAGVDPAEISARSASVATVEAGPFADLIELRHFEDDLAALDAVRDVRVRRFGHGHAAIEVAMTGPYTLARELYQLNRPMQVSDGPEGQVLIELAPLPEREPVEPSPPPESREGGAG